MGRRTDDGDQVSLVAGVALCNRIETAIRLVTRSAGGDREEKECVKIVSRKLFFSKLTLLETWRRLRLVFGHSVEGEGVRGGWSEVKRD